MPIYFFTTEDIEWFTDYAGEQEGNYAIWFYDPDTIDLEPVEQDESGNWRLTANEFDYLEFAYVYADIPQILEDINDSTLIGHVAPDDEEGNSSMPIYLLSTQQIESLTDFPDQTAGNFMIWDMGGWIDLEPAELTDGSWELTDDPSDHIEVNSSQYPTLQSIIEFLGDQHPIGQYYLDQNDSDGNPVDEDVHPTLPGRSNRLMMTSPDDSFTSPDDSFESPDDDFQSPDDSFTSPDDSFESPDDDFHSPDDSFTSPDDSFESPDDDFQSPDDSFTSPDDSFESPDDDFHSPDDSLPRQTTLSNRLMMTSSPQTTRLPPRTTLSNRLMMTSILQTTRLPPRTTLSNRLMMTSILRTTPLPRRTTRLPRQTTLSNRLMMILRTTLSNHLRTTDRRTILSNRLMMTSIPRTTPLPRRTILSNRLMMTSILRTTRLPPRTTLSNRLMTTIPWRRQLHWPSRFCTHHRSSRDSHGWIGSGRQLCNRDFYRLRIRSRFPYTCRCCSARW